MSLFAKPRPQESRAITYQQGWGSGGDWMPAGVASADQAMRLAAVRACVRLIADSVASLPLDLYRRSQDGRTEQITPSSLLTDPSTVVSQFDWLVQCVASLLLDGNAYGLITSRRLGWPSSIEWLDPRTVEVDRVGFRGTYKIDGVDVPSDDVVHVRNIVLPGAVKGISVVQANADVIRLGLEAQRFALDFFLGGGHPTGVIESDQPFEKGTGEQVSARFVDRSKKRGPVALGHGFKYKTIQATPDTTTIEISRMVTADVTRCFGLNPENIGGSGGNSMTYANVEQKTSDMVTFALRPVFTRIERALSAQHPDPEFVRFNADAMVRTDLLTRYQAHEIGIRSRFLTQSEARDLEDLPHIAGTDQLAPLAESAAKRQDATELAQIIQKLYLGVDVVLTAAEARAIIGLTGDLPPPSLPQ